MASLARAQLLQDLASLRAALDDKFVQGATREAAYVRKGLAVNVFNSFEGFVKNRSGELASHVNSGIATFEALPENMRTRLMSRTLEISASMVSRVSEADKNDFYGETSRVLGSVNGVVTISALTWGWKGSNLAADSLADILKAMNVGEPFNQLRVCAGRLGFATVGADGRPANFKNQFDDFAQERHKAAHEPAHQVSLIALGSAGESVLKFAVTFDWLASVASQLLRVANKDYLASDASLLAGALDYATVQERPRDHALLIEDAVRAKRVAATRDAALALAIPYSSDRTLIVVRDLKRNIADWVVPKVG